MNPSKENFIRKQIVNFNWAVAEGREDEQLYKMLCKAYEEGFSEGLLAGNKLSSDTAYGIGLLHGSQK